MEEEFREASEELSPADNDARYEAELQGYYFESAEDFLKWKELQGQPFLAKNQKQDTSFTLRSVRHKKVFSTESSTNGERATRAEFGTIYEQRQRSRLCTGICVEYWQWSTTAAWSYGNRR